jgi:hypothetical protein
MVDHLYTTWMWMVVVANTTLHDKIHTPRTERMWSPRTSDLLEKWVVEIEKGAKQRPDWPE